MITDDGSKGPIQIKCNWTSIFFSASERFLGGKPRGGVKGSISQCHCTALLQATLAPRAKDLLADNSRNLLGEFRGHRQRLAESLVA